MQVILASGGSWNCLTEQCRQALQEASCIIGAPRLLEDLPSVINGSKIALISPKEILQAVSQAEGDCVVLYSGDTGFYSGARTLIPLLEDAGISYQVYPGISSVQMLSAALGKPWQDWLLVSAHGVDCDPVGAVMQGKPVFFLTGGKLTVKSLCQRLTQAGLGDLSVTVGQWLSYPRQQVETAPASHFSQADTAPLSVMLAEPAPNTLHRAPGFPDSLFVRGNVPMTKQEVRAAIISQLSPKPFDVLWDVGAGTGSVSVELALAASRGRTYGIECNPEACALILENREKCGAWNLQLIEGKAPQALENLEAPDGVFIGGTKGSMEPVVDLVLSKNPRARFCISAICIETLYQAVKALESRGIPAQVTQISVSRSRAAGSLHLLAANNPIFLISGQKEEEA